MRIFLVGFMASGKSTVGPRVAKRLGLSFVDLDDVIEQDAERTIPAIFEAEGESGFRQREAEALRRVAQRDDVVVALGGGTFVDAGNRRVALQHGTVVYLDVPPDVILSRVAEEAAHRPLLQDDAGRPLAPDAMEAAIRQLLGTRRPAYETATHGVDAAAPPRTVVERVVDAVGEA